MDRLTQGPIRLVIVDDHQMVLDGLQAMLGPYQDQVRIVAESSDPGTALRLVSELKPDAVLLDVRLGGPAAWTCAARSWPPSPAAGWSS